MGELAVGRLAEDRRLAAQVLEQRSAEDGAGAVIGVEQHAETPLADALHVDGCGDEIDVGRCGVSE